MSELTVISASDIAEHATRDLAFSAVEKALIAITKPDGLLFPVTIGRGLPDESMVAIKSGMSAPEGVVGLKVGTYWPNNRDLGLANHGSTTLLLDPGTGMPTALFNAVALNGLRTAAANAVASNALARPDVEVLLVVGAGHQARCEIAALCDIRPISQVMIWSRNPNHAAELADELSTSASIQVSAQFSTQISAISDLEVAAGEADIITMVTPSTQALIQSTWVRPGTHISAMGADKKGKQELDPRLVEGGKLFADHPPQSVEIGEFQSAAQQELVREQDITAIGRVLTGVCQGRARESDITIFDSSGIALQDIAVAQAILEKIRREGGGFKVSF
ncbi:ornithine cyclodeaminase family protein [Kiloniella majae]|uniref:ornithine cyclodeaminase family protein n=1 Tax=Kiloniella majae TaxID=1938558 RepID=UPI000A276FB5|nr:ornithine cyclodeaminase family protein [Kiloniella majae]